MTNPAIVDVPLSEVVSTSTVGIPANSSTPPRAYKETARQGSLALLDQAMVSGTSFCATLLVGRYASDTEFGTFALGLTVMYFAVQIQQSLVILPYTVLAPRMDEDNRRGFAGSALVQAGLLALGCLLALLGSFLVMNASSGAIHGFAGLLATLAMSVPFVMLREFARRFEFSRLKLAQALAVDTALAALQLMGLGWLTYTNQLTAISAHAMLGTSCAVVGLLWLWRTRAAFAFPAARLANDARRHFTLGKWALAGGLVALANHYSMYWILTAKLGLAATGALAACMTLVDLSNPFMLGASNFVGPRAAHAIHREGSAALRSVVRWSLLIVCGCMGLFVLGIVLEGSNLLTLLFRPELSPHPSVVILLALATFALAFGMPHSEGLTALELPRLNFLAGSLGLIVALITVAFTLDSWGLTGAATAFLVGCSTSALFRAACFWWAAGQREKEERK